MSNLNNRLHEVSKQEIPGAGVRYRYMRKGADLAKTEIIKRFAETYRLCFDGEICWERGLHGDCDCADFYEQLKKV